MAGGSRDGYATIWKDRWTSSMYFWSIASCLIVINAHQDVVLTMTSGERCFGSRVTLLCTHPDPLADSVKYIQQTIHWAEDGTTIDFSDPSNARFAATRSNSTASTLSFTVTEEDHRDRVITCSCFLVLNNANRDREESNIVTIDPPETTTPPTITSLPTSTSDVLRWTHTPNMCSDYTYRYVLIWSRTDTANSPTSGSDTVTTQEYDFSGLPRGKYMVTITAQRVDYPFVRSEPVNMSISLIASDGSTVADTLPSESSTALTAIIVVVCVVVVLALAAIAGVVLASCVVCQRRHKKLKRSRRQRFAVDKRKSEVYANVEVDDHRVTMTTNPGYQKVELSIKTSPVYGNF